MTAARPPAAPTLYCTKCGRVAVHYAATLDPALPLVSCSRYGKDGQEEGCGIQLGSADPITAEGLAADARRKRVTRNHHWHVAKHRLNPLCDECKVDPPAVTAKPHPYEALTTKWRIAGHLENVHFDRSLHTRYGVMAYRELDDHHRRLHG